MRALRRFSRPSFIGAALAAVLAVAAATFVAVPAPASAAIPPGLTFTKAADAAEVAAGDPIGFRLTVTNGSTAVLRGTFIADLLPAGPGITWSIDFQTSNACGLSGAGRFLTCNIVQLSPGASFAVHVASATSSASCGRYFNSGNFSFVDPTPPGSTETMFADATTTVTCPNVSLAKSADDVSVDASEQMGFTITASNSNATGTGTAHGVEIDDPLPGGDHVAWSVVSGPANCAINGTPPSQTLHCTAVDLARGASESVHVVSRTTPDSCGTYSNTAEMSATNAPKRADEAVIRVRCPGVSTKTADAVSPTSRAPAARAAADPPADAPLAATGTDRVRSDLAAAIALILTGGLALMGASGTRGRRRPRT